MENRSSFRIIGFGMILLFIIMPVSPVLAAEFESFSSASAMTPAALEKPDMTIVSAALCDLYGIECDEVTMRKGVYIDPDVWKFSPQWTLIMYGSTKQPENVLNLIDRLNASEKEKAAWKSTIEALWERYPVWAVETEDGLMVTIIPKKSEEWLAPSEEAALQDLADAIAAEMALSLGGGNGVRWSGTAHAGIIKAACIHTAVNNATSTETAVSSSSAPDFWPYGDLIQRCYNHGYLPPSIPPVPGIPTGFGGAPENCQKNATDAATSYAGSQLSDAFASLGHSSHFMTDIGNPMHTGELFVQVP